MAAKILLLVACLALSQAALVKRDAPAAAPSALDELMKTANEFQKTISESLNKAINSKNTEQVNQALKEGSDSVVQQLGIYATSLQGAITDSTGKVKEALEASKANIERTAEELRRSHPEVEHQANELKDRISSALQKAVEESKKLGEEIAKNVDETNKKLAPKLETAYQDFVKTAQDVQKKVQEAANKQ